MNLCAVFKKHWLSSESAISHTKCSKYIMKTNNVKLKKTREPNNISKQAQRRAAAGRSRHKKYGLLQYQG